MSSTTSVKPKSCGEVGFCSTTPQTLECNKKEIINTCGKPVRQPCDDEEARRQVEVFRDPFSLATNEPKYPDGKAQWSMGTKLQRTTEIRDINTAMIVLFPGATNWMVCQNAEKRYPGGSAQAVEITDKNQYENVACCLANHSSNGEVREGVYQRIKNRMYNSDDPWASETAFGTMKTFNELPEINYEWRFDEQQAFDAWRTVSVAMTIDCVGDSDYQEGYFQCARVSVDSLLNEHFGVAYSRWDDPEKRPKNDFPKPTGYASLTDTEKAEFDEIAQKRWEALKHIQYAAEYRSGNVAPFYRFMEFCRKDDYRFLKENPSYSIQKVNGMGRYTFQLNCVKEDNKFIKFKDHVRQVRNPPFWGQITKNIPPFWPIVNYPTDECPPLVLGTENIWGLPPVGETPITLAGAFSASNGAPALGGQFTPDATPNYENQMGFRDFKTEVEQQVTPLNADIRIMYPTAVSEAWTGLGETQDTAYRREQPEDALTNGDCTRIAKEDRIWLPMMSSLVSVAPLDQSRLRETDTTGVNRYTDRGTHSNEYHFGHSFMSQSHDAIVVFLHSFTGDNRFVIRSVCNQEFIVSDKSQYKNFATKAYSYMTGIQAVNEERKRFHKQAYHYMSPTGKGQYFRDEI